MVHCERNDLSGTGSKEWTGADDQCISALLGHGRKGMVEIVLAANGEYDEPQLQHGRAGLQVPQEGFIHGTVAANEYGD